MKTIIRVIKLYPQNNNLVIFRFWLTHEDIRAKSFDFPRLWHPVNYKKDQPCPTCVPKTYWFPHFNYWIEKLISLIGVIYSTIRTAQGRNKELVILRLCMGVCLLDRWLDPFCEKSIQVTVSSACSEKSLHFKLLPNIREESWVLPLCRNKTKP